MTIPTEVDVTITHTPGEDTTITVARPIGGVVGYKLVLSLHVRRPGTSSGFTWPTGFTEEFNHNELFLTNRRLYTLAATKDYTSSEPADYTVTWTGRGRAILACAIYSPTGLGVDLVGAKNTGDGDNTPVYLATTPLNPDSLLLGYAHAERRTGWTGWVPTGMTRSYNSNAEGSTQYGHRAGMAYEGQAGTGTWGPKSWTISTDEGWLTTMMVISEGAAPSGTPYYYHQISGMH